MSKIFCHSSGFLQPVYVHRTNPRRPPIHHGQYQNERETIEEKQKMEQDEWEEVSEEDSEAACQECKTEILAKKKALGLALRSKILLGKKQHTHVRK